jgi:hypothetical protein
MDARLTTFTLGQKFAFMVLFCCEFSVESDHFTLALYSDPKIQATLHTIAFVFETRVYRWRRKVK